MVFSEPSVDQNRPCRAGEPSSRSEPLCTGDSVLKECYKCSQLKPLAEFHKNKVARDGRRTDCKQCVKSRREAFYKNHPGRKREIYERWILSRYPDLKTYRREQSQKYNRIYNRKYQAERRRKLLESRPQQQPCPVCSIIQSKWFCGQWHCVQCLIKESKRKRNERKRAYCFRKRIKHIEEKYGKLAGKVALDYLQKHRNATSVKISYILARCLPPEFLNSHKSYLERIYKLNKLSGLPFTNLGWTCKQCGIYNTEIWFFDIDHIQPRSKNGSSKRSNLQVLCPNCHRLKHLNKSDQYILRQAGACSPVAVRPPDTDNTGQQEPKQHATSGTETLTPTTVPSLCNTIA